MKISTAKREYLIEIEVRKLTPKTIRSYRNNLNLFLRFCEEEAGITKVEKLTLSVVRQFLLYMSGKGRKGGYINGKNHKQRVAPITPVLRKTLLKCDSRAAAELCEQHSREVDFCFHHRRCTEFAKSQVKTIETMLVLQENLRIS